MTTKQNPGDENFDPMVSSREAAPVPRATRYVNGLVGARTLLWWICALAIAYFLPAFHPSKVYAIPCYICSGTLPDDDSDAAGDDDDDDCNPPTANDGPEGGGSDCSSQDDSGDAGMAMWRVSEPCINLWIHDTPLRYRLANGRWRSLTLSYKQRSGIRDTNYAGFGPNWECNWIGVSRITNSAPSTIMVYPLGGGLFLVYVDGTPVYFTGQRMLSPPDLESPLGAVLKFGQLITNGYAAGVDYRFMSERRDRYGRTAFFYWTNRVDLAHPFMQLTNVVDRDGRSCSVVYGNSTFPSYVTSVTDPYGRSASFAYNEKGWLTNITDMAGMQSSFLYHTNGVITNLHTPYGNTGFRHFSGNVGTNVFNRAIEITEASGDQQLYAYRDLGAIDTNSAGGTFFCNDGTTPNRNSYHWNRKQFSLIATDSKTNYLDMPVQEYWKASLKHWLRQATGNILLSDTMSASAGPVLQPNVNDTRSGQVFLQYQGQTTAGYIGTLKRATNIVYNGISYSQGTSKATEITRNDWGRPTGILRHYNGIAVTTSGTLDADGRTLLSYTGRSGEATRGYGYTNTVVPKLLTSVTNALGQVLRYTHDTNGMKVTSFTHPSGLVTTNFYYTTGPTGFLAQTIDVGFRTNYFTYTNGNRCIRTNELGLATTNTWDNLNRPISVQYPDGTYTSNLWDKLDLVGRRDRLGNWTRYTYNAVRQLVAVTNANGTLTQYEYCGCGSPSQITRWNGSTAISNTFSYDLAGQLTNTTYADGYQLNYTYDAFERVSTVTDNGGHAVGLAYNDYDQITAITVGSGADQRYWALRDFDEYGRLTNSIDRNGVTTTNSYDYLDRMLTRRVIGATGDQMSGLESFTYNARGLTNYTDALGKLTRFVRDALSRTSYETNANQEVLGFTYDPANNLATLTDGKLQTTRWNYDGEGRVTNKVDAASAEMFRYQYDPAGRLTNRWQTGGITTTFGYDAVGNLTNIVYPTASSIVLRYDALNRLTNLVDGIGSTAFAWTDGNQLASEDGPWASDTVSFGYTSRQRSSLSVQQPNASAWAQSYGYDGYWRLTNVTSPAGVFGTFYKAVSVGGTNMAADLVAQLNLPGGSYITNNSDDLGRLLSTVLENSTNGVLNSHVYTYNSGHQRTKQTFTAGNYTDYTYDDIGQLKTAKGKESGGATRLHEQLGYAYDAAWNLNYRTNNDLTQTFGVNSLNELTTLSRSGTQTVAGAVSTVPTSVTVKDNANSAVAATVYGDNTFARTNVTLIDGNNTFTAVAQDSLGRKDTNTVTAYLPATATCYYDARGNLTNDGRRVFYYDDENQLTSVLVSNAWKSEFSYDGLLRRRVRKEYTWQSSAWVKTNEMHYVYDGRLVVQERDANNLALVSYTRGNDLSGTMQEAGGIGGLLARTDNGQLLGGSASAHAFYHADGNGNVTALVNTNQLLVAKYAYDPYGNTLAASGPLAEVNLYRFSSKEWHPNSGLVYYLYRYYEPNLQRWLNRDPIGEGGGINLYSFVANDPGDGIDPFGLWQWGWPPWGNKEDEKDKKEKKDKDEKIADACEKVKEATDNVKEVLKDVAEKEIGKRGPMPGSGKIGAAGAAAGGIVEAAMGMAQAGPALTQNAAMAIPNNRAKLGDPWDMDALTKKIEDRNKMANQCQHVSKKLDK